MCDRDQQVLQVLKAAIQERQQLGDLLTFYYDLYEIQFQAKAVLPELDVHDEMATAWRLDQGIAQLTFEQLGIEPQPFARLVSQVAGVLLRHNPSWTLEPQDWSAEELVERAGEIFVTWETLTFPRAEPDGGDAASAGEATGESGPVHPRDLAVSFGLAPYLQKASEQIMPCLALDRWVQSYCPVCGGQPNFALLESKRGARQLVCSRCNSQWGYSRVGCPFCKSKEKQTYYSSDDGVYRLYVCPDCNRYLKTLDRRELQRDVYPDVERLVTVGMDLAAQGLRT